VEGRRAVLEALRAGRPIDRILMAEGIELGPQLRDVVLLADEAEVEVEAVSKAELDRQSHTDKHQGVIAIVADPRYASVEDMMFLADERDEPPLIVVLDGVQDPQNLGAVARTVNAAGAHGAIIPERRAVGITPGSVRASAGALEHILLAREPSLPKSVQFLKQLGLKIVGLDVSGSVTHTGADFTGPTAIVIGSEGEGMSPQVRELCDEMVSIPMYGEVASLNASVSAAVVLYEAVRQRRLSAG
jgi:23S rRNA (guanosine2251-2'-O)-methyltransferase